MMMTRGPADDISEIDMISDARSVTHIRNGSMKQNNLMNNSRIQDESN